MKRRLVLLALGTLGASGCEQFTNLGENYPERDPCEGECVQVPSLGWEGPVLLWVGDPEAVEECPARAPNAVYEGYDGLSTVPQCPSCSCGPSACGLTGLIADSGAMCAGGETPYPAPAAWDGSCVSNGVVTDAQFNSIQYPPMSEAPCEPQTGDVITQTRHDWATMARACKLADPITNTTCPETTVCVPTSEPPPPGFSQCLFKDREELDCPPGYPNRQVFYSDVDTAAVGCTECTCGPPEGADCQAFIEAFSDAACTATISGTIVGTTGEPCGGNLISGLQLGSMNANWVQKQPGACTPGGGEPFGEAVPSGAATFCCKDESP